jgi:hypothetical protein
LLHQAAINESIKGVKVCHGAPSVTQLLFADDSLILLKADAVNVQQLQSILELYESCSWQKINKDQSAIMFSSSVQSPVRDDLKQHFIYQQK